MDPKYAQLHKGVEEAVASATSTELEAAGRAQEAVHQQNELVSECTDVAASTEPLHGDLDQSAASLVPIELGVAERAPALVHHHNEPSERRPAPPSPSAPTSFLRQINKEDITECTDVVVSMEPLQEDLDQTDTDFHAWDDLPLVQEKNHNDIVVTLKPKHGELDSTDADTSKEFDGWIHLPHDVCRLILDLLGAFDTLHFPFVCRPWSEVYADKRRLHPANGLRPGAPTLLTSPSDCGWPIPDDYLRGLFFITNILSREVFHVEVEGMIYGSWVGGKDEWLVTTGRGSSIQLLNPITGRCISLPDQIIGSNDCVKLCRTSTEAEGYFLIAISSHELSYTMEGCDHWITLENPKESLLNYCDAIMHRGKIIAISKNGNLWSWDLDQGGRNPNLLLSSSVNTEGWEQYDFILVPSLKDNILIVSPYGEDIPIIMGHTGPRHSNHWNFFVYGAVLHEVDIDAQSIEEVRDIGDRALFLGQNYPFYVPVSVPMGDLKKNYLYIAALSDHDVVSINLSLEDVPGNVSLIDYSGPSNPDQVPMWFRPAFPLNTD